MNLMQEDLYVNNFSGRTATGVRYTDESLYTELSLKLETQDFPGNCDMVLGLKAGSIHIHIWGDYESAQHLIARKGDYILFMENESGVITPSVYTEGVLEMLWEKVGG